MIFPINRCKTSDILEYTVTSWFGALQLQPVSYFLKLRAKLKLVIASP